jgi:hypothetical protein
MIYFKSDSHLTFHAAWMSLRWIARINSERLLVIVSLWRRARGMPALDTYS